MNTKPKVTTNKFIAFFAVIFFTILFGSFLAIVFPLMFLSFFSLSKFLVGTMLFGITIVATILAMFVVRREYDMSELPAFKASLKLAGVIGFLPLVAYGPMFILQQNFKGLLQVIVWLFVIGLIVYLLLKFSGIRKTDE